MKTRFYFTVGMLFILAGALVGSQYYLPLLNDLNLGTTNVQALVQTRTISPSPRPADTVVISGEPVHITLPTLDVSLDVIPGVYNNANQTWTLSNTKAVFATVTSLPNNQTGNTFIYGHGTSTVLHNLLMATEGTTAIVTTSNGHTFTYMYESQRDTSPSDVSVLKNSSDPRLTLQTCSGFLDQTRRIVTFRLVEAK